MDKDWTLSDQRTERLHQEVERRNLLTNIRLLHKGSEKTDFPKTQWCFLSKQLSEIKSRRYTSQVA